MATAAADDAAASAAGGGALCRRPTRYVKQSVNNWIHARIGAGEQEQRTLQPLIQFEDGILVDPVPQANDVIWRPADEEHDHNGDGHPEGLLFGASQNVIAGPTEAICAGWEQRL